MELYHFVFVGVPQVSAVYVLLFSKSGKSLVDYTTLNCGLLVEHHICIDPAGIHR